MPGLSSQGVSASYSRVAYRPYQFVNIMMSCGGSNGSRVLPEPTSDDI